MALVIHSLFALAAQRLLVLARIASWLFCTLVGACYFPRRLVSRGTRPRVAFQAYAVHLAQFYEPIIRRLSDDDRVDVFFVVLPHPHFSKSERTAVRKLAVDSLGLERGRTMPHWRTVWSRFDMSMYVDVFAVFPFRSHRACLLAHGTTLPGRFFHARPPLHRLFDFDIVFPAGAYDRDWIARESEGQRRLPAVHVVGCPLLDKLFTPALSRSHYLEQLGLADDRPVVLFAPHWQDLNFWEAEGPRVFAEAVQALAELPINLILKPHTMSYVPAATDGRRWRHIVRDLESVRVKVDWTVDDTLALRHADVLITGRSSRAFNFMLLDKPIVMFPLATQASDPVDDMRREMAREAAHVATTTRELADQTIFALHNPGALSEVRRQYAATLFSNAGHATDAVVRAIYRELGINTDRKAESAVAQLVAH